VNNFHSSVRKKITGKNWRRKLSPFMLKPAIWVAIIYLGLLSHAPAEATLLVVSASQQKIILAADSRVTINNDRQSDRFCKIHVLSSNLVFAAAGLVVDMHQSLPDDTRFNVYEVAQVTARNYRYNPESFYSPYDSVKQIANTWGLEMFSRFQKGTAVRLQDWLSHIGGRELDPFVTGVFIGLESNGPSEPSLHSS
jgi:Proteasome subunit